MTGGQVLEGKQVGNKPTEPGIGGSGGNTSTCGSRRRKARNDS